MIAMVVRVDEQVHAAIPRPCLQTINECLCFRRILAVHHHDCITVHEVADRAAAHREEARAVTERVEHWLCRLLLRAKGNPSTEGGERSGRRGAGEEVTSIDRHTSVLRA